VTAIGAPGEIWIGGDGVSRGYLGRDQLTADRYPERARLARERASAPLRHAHEERALREAGASEQEIHELRIRNFGEDAADRMRALDERRAAWDERLARYRAEREATAAAFEDPDRRDREIEALRRAHFGPDEIARVRILDRIEARGQQ